jgi:hypothetical protein
LDHALDLGLAADHGIERVLAGELGEVATELVQQRRLGGLLGRRLRIRGSPPAALETMSHL